ncbi:tRNA pseudouridine synthase A [Gloeomargarita lithophora Alchichica-D10]|uniref:tRNA pseudouridine synthase A n=1 Tax=Gloeomargarita lithophora Alchichica-D10 TaxID=1188229 RepID=A0A1J0AER6_9CYAN|nr:tRNA pseudouridine synthase A [Gloeomargarita lithophora Alchichica-D10]
MQYVGTGFHGWQFQPGQRTVQGVLEQTIGAVTGQPVRITGAGRTDTGVHAAGQVAHFDAPAPIPPQRWGAVLNSRLPPDVLVRASVLVGDDWHARFSAQWRRYRYCIYTDRRNNLFTAPFCWHYYHVPLDVGWMQAALEPLVGRHHLGAFHRSKSGRDHSWVVVQAVRCWRQDAWVYIEVQANAFLYGMMRLLVGMLVEVGRGGWSVAEFTTLWREERRQEVTYAAPARGLTLLGVGYGDNLFSLGMGPTAMPLWGEKI